MTFEEFAVKLKRLQEIQYFEQDEQCKLQEEIGRSQNYSSAFVHSRAYNIYLERYPELVAEGRQLVGEIEEERERRASVIADSHEQSLEFYSGTRKLFAGDNS